MDGVLAQHHNFQSNSSGKAECRFLSSQALLFLMLVFFAASAALAAMLLPEATGDTVYEKGGTTVDASHSDQGYIMVKQKKTDKKLKLRVSLGKAVLTYDLNGDGEFETFPLQLGNGKYKLQVFSQVSGKKYNSLSNQTLKVAVADENLPYLYPNQYVNYDENTLAVAKANELCAGLQTDREKLETVYQYVITHMMYDYVVALKVQGGQLVGYIPNIDDVYTKNMGICFDFAAVTACMLRSQGVPTQLVIGYADKAYHAWNEIFVDGRWERYDPTSAVCATTVKQYTTERMY